jgi:hypothetical protein
LGRSSETEAYAVTMAAPLVGGGWVAPNNYPQENGGGLSPTPVALLLSIALALAFRYEGREIPDEHVGVVLKDVMDDRGKRLDVNVQPLLATEF